MSASIVIEEERGTHRSSHPHNGYYAGDFRATRSQETSLRSFALRSVITASIR